MRLCRWCRSGSQRPESQRRNLTRGVQGSSVNVRLRRPQGASRGTQVLGRIGSAARLRDSGP